jgi:hypothetical protein
MICMESSSPILGSDIPFIYRGRSGTWWFGGVEPMFYMRQSLGGCLLGTNFRVPEEGELMIPNDQNQMDD